METRISELRKDGRDSYADMNVYSLSKVLDILDDITLQSFSPTVIDILKEMGNWILGMWKGTNFHSSYVNVNYW